MAAFLTRDEVIEQLFESESGQESEGGLSEEEDGDKDRDRELLVGLFARFEGGDKLNVSFFKETAVEVLLPIMRQSSMNRSDTQGLKAAHLLSSCTISASSVLCQEARLWLKSIKRRLAGKVAVRRPYYGEIHRNIPYDIFAIISRILRNVDNGSFSEPYCYLGKNKKAEVISFTSLCSLKKLLSTLSGMSTQEVQTFFSRTLKGRRNHHRVELIISPAKDFALVYKTKIGQLDIQFNYGEWNAYGFPQHNCVLQL